MLRAYIETFQKYKYLMKNLVSRDFKVKYRRSVLGVAWSMLSPILMMLILSAVFSSVFRVGEMLEYPFALFVITGQTLFSFFNEGTTSANFSIVDNAQLIKKVYIPKYIFPIEKVLFSFVNLIFSLLATVVMLLIFRIPFTWTMFLVPIPLLALLLFSIGLGLILSSVCVFFRDMKHLYSILTMAWMYVTPVIYPVSTVSGSWIRYIVYINPMTWYIEYFRKLLFFNITAETFPLLWMNIVCFSWAIVALAFGLWVFRKTQDKFILHI